jgi:hypothetical protein
MLSEPQSRSGHGGEKKNSQPLPGLENPIIQHYTTELSQLLSQDVQQCIIFETGWLTDWLTD